MKRLLLTAAVAFGTLAAACGSDAVHNPDFGQPPDAAGFNTGNGGNGGYGSGGNTGGDGGADSGPPVCTDDLKRCAEEFTFPAGAETTVELRGDYRSDAWTKGDPMTKSGGFWKVTVPVPYAKPVQYKLFVDGTTWKVDATKPTITDANNNTNNIAQPITCTSFTCDEPPPPPAEISGAGAEDDSLLAPMMLDAQLAVVSGSRDALSIVRKADSIMTTGPRSFLGENAALLLGRMFMALGEPQLALRALRRTSVYLVDAPYARATIALARARAAVAAGQREEAIESYHLYLAFRSDPGPRLIPQRDSAKAELAKLVSR